MSVSRRTALFRFALGGVVNALAWRSRAHAETITYTYDRAGRVIGVSYANGASVHYTYDNQGNRTSVVTSPPYPPPTELPPAGTVVLDSSTPGGWSWLCTAAGTYDVEVWGPGSCGQGAEVSYDPKYGEVWTSMPGGAGGAYCKRQFSVSLYDALGGRIGAGGVESGIGGSEATTLVSYQSHSLSAGRGNGSTPGTASGGTTNTTGRAPSLVNIWDGGGAGNGGGDQQTPSEAGTAPGGGGAGGFDGAAPYAGAGANGRVLITVR